MWENGQRAMNPLILLSNFFGVSIDYLVGPADRIIIKNACYQIKFPIRKFEDEFIKKICKIFFTDDVLYANKRMK